MTFQEVTQQEQTDDVGDFLLSRSSRLSRGAWRL